MRLRAIVEYAWQRVLVCWWIFSPYLRGGLLRRENEHLEDAV